MTSVLDAVLGTVSDQRQQMAMLMGAILEGGGIGAGPFMVGDSGTSYGPYQFHFLDQYGNWITSKYGLTPQQAQDPSLAVPAISSAYKHAVSLVPDALWQSDPARAAATAVQIAEQPNTTNPNAVAAINQYGTVYGAHAYTAWQELQGVNIADPSHESNGITLVDWWKKGGSILKDFVTPGGILSLPHDLGVPGVPDANPLDAVGGVTGAITGVWGAVSNPHWWWRALFVLGAAALAIMGIALVNRRSIETAVDAGTKVAAVAGA